MDEYIYQIMLLFTPDINGWNMEGQGQNRLEQSREQRIQGLKGEIQHLQAEILKLQDLSEHKKKKKGLCSLRSLNVSI